MNVTSLGFLIRESLDDLICSKKLKDKRVILFGKNAPSEAMFRYLMQNGFKDIDYVDNDPNKNVLTPEEALTPYREDTLILIASKHFQVMAEQVARLGYDIETQVVKVIDFYNIENISRDYQKANSYRRMTLTECREKQLQIMDIVHEICLENDIRYSLGYGTLLGAIRHKGFIPWDDDVDLIMPYPDYCRFMNLVESDDRIRPVWRKKYQEKYPFFLGRVEYLKSMQVSWEYPFLFHGGMTVDVFPVWGMPDTKEEQLVLFQNVCAHKNKMTQFSILDGSDVEFEDLHKQAIEFEEKYPFDSSKYAGYIAGSSGMDGIMDSEIFRHTTLLPFEDRKYNGLRDYDQYLKAIYGDYMTPPQTNERTSNHSMNIFDVEL